MVFTTTLNRHYILYVDSFRPSSAVSGEIKKKKKKKFAFGIYISLTAVRFYDRKKRFCTSVPNSRFGRKRVRSTTRWTLQRHGRPRPPNSILLYRHLHTAAACGSRASGDAKRGVTYTITITSTYPGDIVEGSGGGGQGEK